MLWGDYTRMRRELEVVLTGRVCQTCNRGFMKRLDDRMRQVMGKSITDAVPVDLTENQQTRVARWAFKVALLLMLWVHDECARQPELIEAARKADGGPPSEPYVPIDAFLYMGRRHLPPRHVRIWFGAANEELPDCFSSVSALSRPTPDGPQRIGYCVLFALRHLIVCVLAGTSDHGDVLGQAVGRFVDPADLAPDILVAVWPPTEQTGPRRASLRQPILKASPPRDSSGTRTTHQRTSNQRARSRGRA